MPFDMPFDAPVARRETGRRNHLGGLAAEDNVLRLYQRQGARLAARRWRGSRGEIDLVLDTRDGLVFVEVKSAATHARAAESIGAAQIRRIHRTAEEYVGRRHGHLSVDMRFDLALVDGQGAVEVREAALWV